MTDNEITREKTFSEELPYFKERIKEVFDNYDNPNGYEDPLYIAVLRDSKRIVRKAEEEITRQQTEIESLKENRDELWEIHCRDTERYLEHIDEIDTLKKELKTAKSEAIKDFAERVKKELLLLKKECRKALDNDGVFAIKRARKKIDKLVKEMVGESND